MVRHKQRQAQMPPTTPIRGLSTAAERAARASGSNRRGSSGSSSGAKQKQKQKQPVTAAAAMPRRPQSPSDASKRAHSSPRVVAGKAKPRAPTSAWTTGTSSSSKGNSNSNSNSQRGRRSNVNHKAPRAAALYEAEDEDGDGDEDEDADMGMVGASRSHVGYDAVGSLASLSTFQPKLQQRSVDASVAHRIDELQEICDRYTKRIEVERRRREELEKKLRVTQEKLEQVRESVGPLDTRQTMITRQKQLSMEENRLNKVLVRLNQALTHNDGVRRTIENLRRERLHGLSLQRKMEKQLAEARSTTTEAVATTAEAAGQFERANRQCAVLEQTIEQEVEEFEHAFQQRLQHLREEREKDRVGLAHGQSSAFLGRTAAASAKPMSAQGGTRADATAAAVAAAMDAKGDMTVSQEAEVKHLSTKALWDIVKREVELQQQEDLLTHYQQAFQTISQRTGIETVDEMVADFVAAEDHNFSLINMINALNKEIEDLEVENGALDAKLRTAQGQGEETEAQRSTVYKVLDDQIKAADKKARWYTRKHDEALKAISGMRTGLMNIFQKVGWSDDAVMENIAATGVTDSNIMQVLGIIEQRIAEIVQMNELSLGRMLSTHPSMPRQGHALSDVAALPSAMDASDSDDDDISGMPSTRPLTVAELKSRTKAAFSRRKAAREAAEAAAVAAAAAVATETTAAAAAVAVAAPGKASIVNRLGE